MPIDTNIQESNDLTIFTGSGELLLAEVLNAIKSFYSGPITLNVVWDLRQATVPDITSDDVNQIAGMLKTLRADRKEGRTTLVSPKDAMYGLSRMLELLLDSLGDSRVEMRVFRDFDEAIAWLDQKE